MGRIRARKGGIKGFTSPSLEMARLHHLPICGTDEWTRRIPNHIIPPGYWLARLNVVFFLFFLFAF